MIECDLVGAHGEVRDPVDIVGRGKRGRENELISTGATGQGVVVALAVEDIVAADKNTVAATRCPTGIS